MNNEFKTIIEMQNKSQLNEKANYIQKPGNTGAETAVNMIAGYEGNDIISDVHSAVIGGGGMLGYENIIGGNTANVGTATPNVADLLGSGADYAVIGGGYDNVNNALAGVLTGFHCKMEQSATHATISGGSYHEVNSGDYGTIGGGTHNKINPSVEIDGATIGGGLYNECNAQAGVIAGGENNVVTDSDSSILGGKQNVIDKSFGTIGGGQQNEVHQSFGTVNGGYLNKVILTGSEFGATIGGGRQNSAYGEYSTITGGRENIAQEQYSIANGYQAKANLAGQRALANGMFATAGDAQASDMVIKKITTDATEGLLFNTRNSSPTILTNSAVLFKARIVAHRTDVQGDNAAFEINGLATKASGAVVVIGSPTVTTLFASAGASAWSVRFWAGTSTLNFAVTGEAGKTIQWVGKVEYIETVG